MSVVIQSLFPIPYGDTYIDPLPIIIMFHGRNARVLYDVLSVSSSGQETFPFLQLQDTTSGPPLFLFNWSSNLLLWLFKISCIFFVQE